MFGSGPHLSVDGDLVETLASLLGALIVLCAGTVWRNRKLGEAERKGRRAKPQ
jgi:hypothetical protein